MFHFAEWEPEIYARGENATIHICLHDIYGMSFFEINFSGYTGKQLFTNVMLYDPMKSQGDIISINKNYTGRLERIEISNVSLSFLLLSVNFMDSGNYTAFQDSMIKGKTSILIPRRQFHGQDGEPMILNFRCNITYATSINIEMMISKKLHFLVVKYDVTRANCTDIGNLYMDRIDNCVLKDSNFSFTIRKVSLIDVGLYVAWNDVDFFIDSAFLAFEENNATSSSKSTQKYESSQFIQKILSSEAENCK
ncbi:hypothetical protein CHS0354_020863 [Potamilus streckersoni]|uniref:Uncharacterized protein n=1 Tax=Potamilus streckersoni TaxID=2493646 RepID=A0AAE0SF46_9BIVA|nr:hypothetical protein CHS0354_020863 [Potamilus streckersoni]